MNEEFKPEEIQEKEIDYVALFYKYLPYWPWFVISVFACALCTFVWLRYQAPVYSIDSSLLIKEQENQSNNAAGLMSSVTDLGMFSMTSNFDNEIEILKSRTLIQRVVEDLNLYASVSQRRLTGYDLPLYGTTSPLRIQMAPAEAAKLEAPVQLTLDYAADGSLQVEGEYELDKEEYTFDARFDSLPAVLPTPVGTIAFSQQATYKGETDKTHALKATITSPLATARAYVAALTVAPTSKTTTIANITLQNTIKARGVDFIYSLVEHYNRDANNEKNEVAQKSAEFIAERIDIINSELGSADSQLASFKQRSGLTDVTSDAQRALSEVSRYEQQRTENAIQIRMVQFLSDYIHNPANDNEVLPVNVGLTDQNLSSVIEQYNAMLIERKRLLQTSSEMNPAVINLNTGIQAMRQNVLTTVSSALEGLKIAQADIERQANKFEGRISNAPIQEKEYLSMARQQEIKAALYTMLLQKREENAITLASTANNGRIIKEPLAAIAPVAPKKMMILLAAMIVGLCIPVAILYLKHLLKYKIENSEDIAELTTVPLIGELPLASTPETGAIVVQENQNGLMEETFRSLRTNLLFMLQPEQKVILFTSSQPGEGKSFVAGNLAVSLAYLGKKVLIVGLDIRKPGLNKVFTLSTKAQGITSYLSHPESTDLKSLIQTSQLSPNLHILPGGTVPPNPTELMARPALEEAISWMKERYDYIILDTAPIAAVTDTAIAGRVADMCVYVSRADVTPKAAYGYINVLKQNNQFPQLATVLNSIDWNLRKNRRGYGYGYGYGSHYGYGYGYGYDQKKK